MYESYTPRGMLKYKHSKERIIKGDNEEFQRVRYDVRCMRMRREDTGTTRERPCPRLLPIPPLGKDEMENVNGNDERKQE